VYELAGKLMNANTTTDELQVLIETLYPAFVDAEVAVAQFDVVRRIPARMMQSHCSSEHWRVYPV